FYLVVVVSSVIHATGVIVAALLGVKRRPGGGDVYDWGTNDWSRQVLWAAGTPVRAEGLDRIPDRPVVYAANHSSMFDIWALAAPVPVVPVYVGNTFEIMPKGRLFLRPRPIRIVIGEPISTAGMTVERRQELRDRAHAAILALKARVDAEGGDR